MLFDTFIVPIAVCMDMKADRVSVYTCVYLILCVYGYIFETAIFTFTFFAPDVPIIYFKGIFVPMSMTWHAINL